MTAHLGRKLRALRRSWRVYSAAMGRCGRIHGAYVGRHDGPGEACSECLDWANMQVPR